MFDLIFHFLIRSHYEFSELLLAGEQDLFLLALQFQAIIETLATINDMEMRSLVGLTWHCLGP